MAALEAKDLVDVAAQLVEAVASFHGGIGSSCGASDGGASRMLHLDLRPSSVRIVSTIEALPTVHSMQNEGRSQQWQWQVQQVALHKVTVFSPALAHNYEWMAPEVTTWAVDMLPRVGQAADVFSLGILLWQLLQAATVLAAASDSTHTKHSGSAAALTPAEGFAHRKSIGTQQQHQQQQQEVGEQRVAEWYAQGNRPAFSLEQEQIMSASHFGSKNALPWMFSWAAVVRACWRDAANERPSALNVAAAMRQLQQSAEGCLEGTDPCTAADDTHLLHYSTANTHSLQHYSHLSDVAAHYSGIDCDLQREQQEQRQQHRGVGESMRQWSMALAHAESAHRRSCSAASAISTDMFQLDTRPACVALPEGVPPPTSGADDAHRVSHMYAPGSSGSGAGSWSSVLDDGSVYL
jgi:hypothetical protein